MVIVQGQAQLFEVVAALHPPAASRAACTAGSKSEIKMPMIVMTVRSSTSVNACRRDGGSIRSGGFEDIESLRRLANFQSRMANASSPLKKSYVGVAVVLPPPESPPKQGWRYNCHPNNLAWTTFPTGC